ncbi:aminodeoxychorismate synthase component I [Macrococcus lamae]|uniref:Aminodeoxychorismate synthase component I n=1 Tax=Macrococcus lamae TaxID=198484 RepID=A0A4R6BVA0_9STAP|nr:aminodeoxychorismate synthase component I [Macrococcus lamae]TDM12201.1 aminodeoxychorismate synthase component I [Macrococcus lamae]
MIRACVQFHSMADNQPIELYFKNPVDILIASEISEVTAVLDQVEQYSQEYYVVGYTAYEAAAAFSSKMKVKSVDTYAKFYIFKEPAAPFDDCELMRPMEFQFNASKQHIVAQINHIKEQISKGNTYQVNYTVRLQSASSNAPYAVYKLLTHDQNGQYTAYIEDDDEAVISISPELFFEYDKTTGHIYTKPMKGTMPRSNSADNYNQLQYSKKDQAENVMIVDLLRNDLSRIALKNSVNVSSLFEITAYATVYQMTSTIEATLPAHISMNQLFEALYPCGSITGAPKISTMAIIDQLEDKPRGIYCGAVGIMLPDGRTIFNVPIRTLVKQGQNFVYGVGGGITVDSVPEKEYDEMVAKTQILNALKQDDFHLIETMRIDESGIKRWDYHVKRLVQSLNHFNMNYEKEQLDNIAGLTTEGTKMLRLTASDGKIFYELNEIPVIKNATAVLRPMLETDGDKLRYKTSRRDHYKVDNDRLSLYYNQKMLITEFNIGNLVYKLHDSLFTPFVHDMLAGCMRQQLIDEGMIGERNLSLSELIDNKHKIKLWMVNSLREWTEVRLESDSETINGNSVQKSVE